MFIERGFDVAVHTTPIRESSLVARKIANLRWLLCASPNYLQRHGEPHRPRDLTVGDALEADILLHLDDIANATIFDLPQRSSRQFATLPTFASLQEFLRAQQAADMIGAERRSRLGHWMLPFANNFQNYVIRSLALLDRDEKS
jgi:DNA-binding transcriptional LysR family regulator